MTLGQLLKELRQERGLTQLDMAFIAGETPGRISRIERDLPHTSSMDIVSNITRALLGVAP